MTTSFFFVQMSDRQTDFIITQQSLILSIKHVHLHYEILLRPTSPEGKQGRNREERRK